MSKRASRLFPQESLRPKQGGWAPGGYHCTCTTCDKHFIGDKRAWICAECAYHDFDKMDLLLATNGTIRIDYPVDNQMKAKGAQLLDFVNYYIKTHPELESTYLRTEEIGYWEIKIRNTE